MKHLTPMELNDLIRMLDPFQNPTELVIERDVLKQVQWFE